MKEKNIKKIVPTNIEKKVRISPNKGKKLEDIVGKKRASIIKKKMSESGKIKIFTKKHRQNLSINSSSKRIDVRKKMSMAKKGKTWEEIYGNEYSIEKKQKQSLMMKGNKLGLGNKSTTGKHWKLSEESKRKHRISTIQRIIRNKGQVNPNYNPQVIPILEQKAKELGITDLKHAENGGEHYISELGYWVDGYSPSKNIIIEYYEKNHKYKREKDIERIKEIKNFLNCKIIIIREWNNTIEIK